MARASAIGTALVAHAPAVSSTAPPKPVQRNSSGAGVVVVTGAVRRWVGVDGICTEETVLSGQIVMRPTAVAFVRTTRG
ncbi:hypothetical protein GCM10022267_38550 [Lentzea roselyniae]|uniref:Secreted protein n=1 Tax=Lentzea roselyniae TaxID=531940 RepID=A0ABP7B590_9PSEU